MKHKWWVAEKDGDSGLLLISPLEANKGGNITITTGLCYVTTPRRLKEFGAEKVWLVDNVYEPTKWELIYNKHNMGEKEQ